MTPPSIRSKKRSSPFEVSDEALEAAAGTVKDKAGSLHAGVLLGPRHLPRLIGS